MKKYISGVLCGVLIATFSIIAYSQNISVEAYVNQNLKFFFNGSEKLLEEEYKPLIFEDRSYLPARFIAENLNADVYYNHENRSIYFQTSNTEQENSDILDKLNEKILSYEEEINGLNTKIKILEEKLSDSNSYRKLPLTQNLKDYRVTVQSLDLNYASNVSRLYLSIENIQSSRVIKLSPLDTVITVDGIEYKAQPIDIDTSIYGNVNIDTIKSGHVTFRNLPQNVENYRIDVKVLIGNLEENEQIISFYVER